MVLSVGFAPIYGKGGEKEVEEKLRKKIQVAPGTELQSWEEKPLLLSLYMDVIPNMRETEGNVTETLQLGPISTYEAKCGRKEVMRAKYRFLLRSMIALRR